MNNVKKVLRSPATTVAGVMIAASLCGAVSADVTNADWPWQCGSSGTLYEYEVKEYLRFYPSERTALRNVVLDNIDGSVADSKYDSHDILTGFVVNKNGNPYRHVVYTSENVSSQPSGPLSIVVPLWFPTPVVDFEDFKLRQAAGTVPRIYNPDIPNDTSIVRGGGMLQGATNYPCVVKIGNTVGDYTLAYVQGYVWRPDSLSNYLELAN